MMDITASRIIKAVELAAAANTETVTCPLATVAIVVVDDLLPLMTGIFTDFICLSLISSARSLSKT